jgi:hypothetical protein
MGIAHLAAGLVAKRIAPKAPLVVLLVASESLDILWGVFAFTGLDTSRYSPWSHGLFMAAVWTLLASLLAMRIYHSRRTALIIALVVFSHWLLDLISHPMGVLGLGNQPDLPLLFDGSIKVGLGLYTLHSLAVVTAIELGLLALGLWVYLPTTRRFRKDPSALPGDKP